MGETMESEIEKKNSEILNLTRALKKSIKQQQNLLEQIELMKKENSSNSFFNYYFSKISYFICKLSQNEKVSSEKNFQECSENQELSKIEECSCRKCHPENMIEECLKFFKGYFRFMFFFLIFWYLLNFLYVFLKIKI
jgi:hypothetical protein